MVAMSSPAKNLRKQITSDKSAKEARGFISRLSRDYPDFKFQKGRSEHWSPRANSITYQPNQAFTDLRYGVLHELAHALLGHKTYASDFELLKLEGLAWQKAADIGRKYKVNIDTEHVQNCLDTYRDWLHRRSTCPVCGNHGLQKDSRAYQCFNCRAVWRVSSGRFVRPYRLTRGVS